MLDVAPDFSTFASMHAEDYRELARKAAGRPLKVQVARLRRPRRRRRHPGKRRSAGSWKRRHGSRRCKRPSTCSAGRSFEVRENKP